MRIHVRILPYGFADWIELQEYEGDDADLAKEIATHTDNYGASEYLGAGCYQWTDEYMTRYQVTNLSYYEQEVA